MHEGLLQAVKQGAASRGADLVEATREAVLVCRKALRGDPDGRTASSLLSALCRARETEDRIARLDHGDATEIQGHSLSEEDRVAFQEWWTQRQAPPRSYDVVMKELNEEMLGVMKRGMEQRDSPLILGSLRAMATHDGVLCYLLREDAELARKLHVILQRAVKEAEESPRTPVTSYSLSWWDTTQERS